MDLISLITSCDFPTQSNPIKVAGTRLRTLQTPVCSITGRPQLRGESKFFFVNLLEGGVVATATRDAAASLTFTRFTVPSNFLRFANPTRCMQPVPALLSAGRHLARHNRSARGCCMSKSNPRAVGRCNI